MSRGFPLPLTQPSPPRGERIKVRGAVRYGGFFLVLAIIATPLSAAAQQAAKIPRIGILGNAPSRLWEAFEQRLRELGYLPHQSVALEYRWSEAKPQRFPELAADLVGRKVDVIVAVSEPAGRAAKQATSTIPIVVFVGYDPVASGLVASLARPGGNVTGLSMFHVELTGKRLELLKEVVPKASRIAVLWHAADPSVERAFKETRGAALALGLTVRSHAVSEVAQLEGAFTTISRERPGALIVLPNPFAYINRTRIAELAAKARVPAIYGHRENVEAGGLMSYATDVRDVWQRGAIYVDKILKGTKPADLPVEQPTRFELVINLKAAKALGLTLPQSILIRADQVIQ